MKKMTYLIIFSLSLSLLSACGWRLRGSDDGASLQQAVYLETASGEVYQRIKRTLEKKKNLASVAEADIQLALGKEFFDRRTSSVNNQARTTQYQLTLSVSYEVLDASGKPLTQKSTAELTRYYNFDQNAITSASKEEQALRKEMVRQVARQILQRISFLSKK